MSIMTFIFSKQPTNDQVCPVCTKVFPSHVIETHAAYCGERNQDIILCQEAEDPARYLMILIFCPEIVVKWFNGSDLKDRAL